MFNFCFKNFQHFSYFPFPNTFFCNFYIPFLKDPILLKRLFTSYPKLKVFSSYRYFLFRYLLFYHCNLWIRAMSKLKWSTNGSRRMTNSINFGSSMTPRPFAKETNKTTLDASYNNSLCTKRAFLATHFVQLTQYDVISHRPRFH